MKTADFTFHYSHLLPKKPSVCPRDPEQEKTCGCGEKFTTRSRKRKRCDACREKRRKVIEARGNARAKAKRAARKEKGLL